VTCVFGKQSLPPFLCPPASLLCTIHDTGAPFSRSYRSILPSSLTRVISSTLVFSTCPPVSVLVRTNNTKLRRFSWQQGFVDFKPLLQHASRPQLNIRISLYVSTPTSLHGFFHSSASTILLRHSIAHVIRFRIIRLIAIEYASQPLLRNRLTPGGFAFPGKP
jgi:hypothetical protein